MKRSDIWKAFNLHKNLEAINDVTPSEKSFRATAMVNGKFPDDFQKFFAQRGKDVLWTAHLNWRRAEITRLKIELGGLDEGLKAELEAVETERS